MNDSMLIQFIAKQVVATRFAKAHCTYTHQALIQKQVAQHLTVLMQEYLERSDFQQALEIGCGTGNFTQCLVQHFEIYNLILNDLYPDVESNIQHDQVEWMIGDVEKIDLPSKLDLCVSSSVLQWMVDFEALLKRLWKALIPHGYLCFSTYGPNNLKEIKSLTGQGLKYFDHAQLIEKLEFNGFEVIYSEQQLSQLHFEHPKQILKHLQATGVTATSTGFRWNKQSLNQFYLGYRQFITTDEHENLVYPITYHPIYIIARRKP